jgi:hypothetical protein
MPNDPNHDSAETSELPAVTPPIVSDQPPAAPIPPAPPAPPILAANFGPNAGAVPNPNFGPYPYAGYDPTFAPVPRPPRSPWIAPQRKAAATVIAIVAAVVLLGLGFLGGSLLTRGGDNHRPGFDRTGHHRTFGPPNGVNGPANGSNTRPLPRRSAAPSPSASSPS